MIPIGEELNPNRRVDKMQVHMTHGRKCWIPDTKVESRQNGRRRQYGLGGSTDGRGDGADGEDNRVSGYRFEISRLASTEDDGKRRRRRTKKKIQAHGDINSLFLTKRGKIPLVPGRETALWFLGGKTIMDSFL
jgi:hypothetical protein